MARRNDGRDKREPLAEGNPRRITDAMCAWRKMTDEQRVEFLSTILPGATGQRILPILREQGWRF